VPKQGLGYLWLLILNSVFELDFFLFPQAERGVVVVRQDLGPMATRSAYFSRDEEGESVSRRQLSIVSPEVDRSHLSKEREVLVHAMGAPTEFPNSRAVLWDRTPCGNPSYVRSSEVVPALYLSPIAIRALLESLCNVKEGSNGSVDLCATVVSLDSLSEQQGLGPEKPLRSILGTPPFLLQVSPPSAANVPFGSSSSNNSNNNNNNSNSNFSLTIPVSRRPLDGSVLDFPKEATTSLIANLGKAVCTTKSSTLRNCMRIRAAGQVQKANGMLNGVLRFEAVLSDVSFQAIKIRPLPMLSTPLSLKLTRATTNRPPVGVDGAFVGGSAAGPCMGYLTLNQTRKIIPLLETDPAVSLAPMIGIWVSAEDFSSGQQQHLDEQNQVFLRHPIVWAACLRFLYNEKICDRAFVAQETFLLAICGCSVEFFEITRMPNGPQAASPETAATLSSSDYLCCDFTVDLAVDEETTDFSAPRGSPRCTDPVVCKFRPLSRVEYIRSFREAGVVAPSLRRSLQPTSSLLLKAKSVSASYQGPSSSVPTTSSSSEFPQQLTESLSITETRTPLPRNASSLPEAIAKEANFSPRSPAPGVHSALISISDCVEEQHQTHAHVSSPFSQQHHIAAFPAEVILSQQIQLDDLRKEVAELRAVIQGLIGGSIPLALASLTPPASSMPAASAPDVATSSFTTSASSSSSSSANSPEQRRRLDDDEASEHLQSETSMRTAFFVPPNSSLSAEVASIIESEKDEEEEAEHDTPLYLNREQRADIAVPPPRKQTGTRHNPLASRNPTFPVLRPRGEDEADLMEPSAGSIRFGDSAFPSPHANDQGLDDLDEEEAYDDYDGDGLDISRTSFSLDVHLEEGSSMYEAESLLAIQARYLSER